MEVAVGIGGRHDNRKAVFSVAFGAVDDGVFGLEGAGSLPFGINARFKISRNITLCETHVSIIPQVGVIGVGMADLWTLRASYYCVIELVRNVKVRG